MKERKKEKKLKKKKERKKARKKERKKEREKQRNKQTTTDRQIKLYERMIKKIQSSVVMHMHTIYIEFTIGNDSKSGC